MDTIKYTEIKQESSRIEIHGDNVEVRKSSMSRRRKCARSRSWLPRRRKPLP